MRFSSATAWLLAASTVVVDGSAVPQTHVVHEKRLANRPPLGRDSELSGNLVLPVRIGLVQNEHAMRNAEDWLMEVSHPESSKYAQHWSQEQVIQAFQPDEADVKKVSDWITSSIAVPADRITHSDNKLWLAFEASVDQVQKLLHTTLYQSEDGAGRTMIAAEEYSVPAEIQPLLDYISPGVKPIYVATEEIVRRGGHPSRKRTVVRGSTDSHTLPPPSLPNLFKHFKLPWFPWGADDISHCDELVTPACIRALYDIPERSPYLPVNTGNTLGIFEEGSYYDQEDLNLFYANYTPYIPQGFHPKCESIDGGQCVNKNVSNADYVGGEAVLDFTLAIPLIYPQVPVLFQTDDNYYATANISGFFNTFLDAVDGSYCTYCAYGECGNSPTDDPVYPDPRPGGYKGKLQCGVYKPTDVISVSYGQNEDDVSANYQKRQCQEMLKLGLQGVSILFASGDSGVASRSYEGKFGNGCLGPKGDIFNPGSPVNCPWVTVVGATKIEPGQSVFSPECGALDPAGDPYRNEFASGGGFSNIYPIPKYQAGAVASYFQNHNPPYPYYENGNYENATNGGVYNRNGRGYPDVSANGDSIAMYIGGEATFSGGTSASTPIFASVIDRLNAARMKIGKRPIGFLNTALYHNPSVLKDITCGSNPGCNSAGFSAVTGWDPVTGLGTPNFPSMLAYFLSLP